MADGRTHARGRELRGRIAQQMLCLPHRPALPEELRRDIRHLMRLVENDRLGAGQKVAEPLLLERKIREQQVMVDDDDLGGLRGAACLEHVAARELRALLPEAVLARRGDHRPRRRLFGQVGELGQVARLGNRRPACDPREQPRRAALAAEQRTLLCGELQAVAAQIVRAPFEERHLDRQSERARERGHVAPEQLVLQRARAGGNDDAASRQKRRHEVGEGLTGSRAGLDDQGFAERERAPHRRGHLRLLGAAGIARQCARERAVGAENVAIVRCGTRAHGALAYDASWAASREISRRTT